MTATIETPSDVQRITVWFGDQTLCEYDAAPERAQRYAKLTEQRFFGLTVTVEPAPHDEPAASLPDPSSWSLTVK